MRIDEVIEVSLTEKGKQCATAILIDTTCRFFPKCPHCGIESRKSEKGLWTTYYWDKVENVITCRKCANTVVTLEQLAELCFKKAEEEENIPK